MYQFYYADEKQTYHRKACRDDVRNHFRIEAVRPAMWEEHCLECSAPACFDSCVHYRARSDGRCMRFANGLLTYPEKKACCGQGVHVKFRKWANMMTIIFPAMLSEKQYRALFQEEEKRGRKLKKIAESRMPEKIRWESIRSVEYLRRKSLRGMKAVPERADAFLFHGYSYNREDYRLIIEIYDDHTPVFKTSLPITEGENLFVLGREQLSAACSHAGYLVKVYPENNLEAELDLLWCDFVKGKPAAASRTKETATSGSGESLQNEAPLPERPAGKVKCVVWDLDNTLWDGTLIESDPDTLKLRPGVMDTIRALDARGILQSAASKNEYDQAWPVVERLGLADYFLYPQIHWNAKSGSIRQIAKALNIGIDTFALIDDSAFEREQVRSSLPQVRTYEDVTGLCDRPEFTVPVTEESKNRRQMYQAEAARKAVLADGNEDTVSFLKRCHLRIHIFRPETEEELLRCYELTIRTNQLNMSGKKYTEEEFREILARKEHRNFAFSCEDDFGAYGIVGFGQYYVQGDTLIFTEFAMSCRAAGKYVESALFTALLKREGAKEGHFGVKITKKNVLLRRTLAGIGFREVSGESGQVQYVFGRELLHADLADAEERA